MEYQTLVKHKLQKDLFNLLQNVHKQYEDVITYTDFCTLLTKLIEQKISSFTMRFHDEEEQWNDTRSRCCAREWFHHRGKRCSNLRINNTCEYCKIHQHIIRRDDSLLFGRYDEPPPKFTSNGQPITWYDFTFEQQINILLELQHNRFQEAINIDNE